MKNYMILHGSFSSPFSNWIPYLRNELEQRNLEVYTPDLPSGVGFQNYTNCPNFLIIYNSYKNTGKRCHFTVFL